MNDDKSKIMQVFAALGEIQIPMMSSTEGKSLAGDIIKQLIVLMSTIKSQADNL